MTLYIIRHGETDMNRQNIVQGRGVDSELNLAGRTQAQLFHAHYKDVPFDWVLTSSLRRTHQTVAPFIKHSPDLDWTKLTELDEISWGAHEGKPSNGQMKDDYLQTMRAWYSGDYDARTQGGESAAELRARVLSALEILKSQVGKKKNILLCTHGRTLLCLMTILTNQPLLKMNQFRHENVCLYKVHVREDGFEVELYNDRTHLGDFKSAGF
jgi:phosphoserine phosphatase